MKIIILDRDGVINHDSENYIKTPREWKEIDGSLEAISILSKNKWKVVIATNQSGVGRGIITAESLSAIHEKMITKINKLGGKIDSIFFCPHTPSDLCKCRKPMPGMFYQIEEKYNCKLKNRPAVGDSLRDLQAAKQVGCIPMLVMTGKGHNTYKQEILPKNTKLFSNLLSASEFILRNE